MQFWPLCCESKAILSKTFRFSYGKIFIPVTKVSGPVHMSSVNRAGSVSEISVFAISVDRDENFPI